MRFLSIEIHTQAVISMKVVSVLLFYPKTSVLATHSHFVVTWRDRTFTIGSHHWNWWAQIQRGIRERYGNVCRYRREPNRWGDIVGIDAHRVLWDWKVSVRFVLCALCSGVLGHVINGCLFLMNIVMRLMSTNIVEDQIGDVKMSSWILIHVVYYETEKSELILMHRVLVSFSAVTAQARKSNDNYCTSTAKWTWHSRGSEYQIRCHWIWLLQIATQRGLYSWFGNTAHRTSCT